MALIIPPSSAVNFYIGIPLDPDYHNTILFANRGLQAAYFAGQAAYYAENVSYQRAERNAIKVQLAMEQLIRCNYMSFVNIGTGFEGKTYYAFITSVEYINNTTTLVRYEIDVMQTWFPDCTLGHCFVEREHSEVDFPGSNIVAEDIKCEDYEHTLAGVFQADTPLGQDLDLRNLSLIIAYDAVLIDILKWFSADDAYVFPPGMHGGNFMGLNFVVFDINNPEIEQKVVQFFSTVDLLTSGGFITAFLYPTQMIPTPGDYTTETPGRYFNTRWVEYVPRFTTLSGYTPRNQKLLTAPYLLAHLTNHRTAGNDFAFEFSDDVNGGMYFRLEGALSISPSVIAYPTRYCGINEYLAGSVMIDGYPVCPWAADGLTEWINNNLFKTLAAAAISAPGISIPLPGAVGFSGGAMSNGMGQALLPGYISTGAPQAAAIMQSVHNYVEDVSTRISNNWEQSTLKGQLYGGGRGDIMFGTQSGKEINVYYKTIKAEQAAKIDSYFDMVGYATRELKVPNIKSRQNWNYLKTSSVILNGSIPAEAEIAIKNILNNGITFWHSASAVGNYSLSNRPISG